MRKPSFNIDNSSLKKDFVAERDNLFFYSYKIVSYKHKFIYLEYPKTASSSIKTLIFPKLYKEFRGSFPFCLYKSKYLLKKGLGKKPSRWPFGGPGDQTWRKIIPEAHFTGNPNEKKYKDYFVFSVIRNPFDKMVSAYRHGAWGEVNASNETFEDFVFSLLPGGSRELTDIQHRGKNHFLPWTTLFDESWPDFIIRFENLARDINYLMEHIGISAPFYKENASRSSTEYRSYYNQETREIVESLYKKDLEVFGYTF